MEIGFDIREKDHRAISPCAFEHTRLRKPDGVVEGQAKDLVNLSRRICLVGWAVYKEKID